MAVRSHDLVRQAREGVAQDPRDGSAGAGSAWSARQTGCPAPRETRTPPPAASQGSEAEVVSFISPRSTRGSEEPTRRCARCAGPSIRIQPTRRRSGASGSWLLDQNQLAGAERAFNRATEIDPADRAGWIGLARVYLQRNEATRAAGLLERLVQR